MEKTKVKDAVNMKDYIATIAILDSIADAIFILDSSGKIEYANRGALDLVRLNHDELLGLSMEDLVVTDVYNLHRRNKSAGGNAEWLQLNKSGFSNMEVSLRVENTTVPVMLSYNTVFKDDEVKYIIITARDITSWKLVEDEIRQQQALSISRNKMENLGKLSVSMVHELTQPLSSLKLRTEVLATHLDKKNLEPEKMHEHIGSMMELIDKMAAKIESLRTYAQDIENNTFGMIEINTAITNSLEQVSYEMADNSIKIVLNKSSQSPYVYSNKLMLEQVFINIFKNSLEAFLGRNNHIKDERRITIDINNVDNKWVEIQITDNAGGIPASLHPQIFKPFFTSKPKEYHSGIGLSLAKNVITSLGGDIDFRSEENSGTTFMISIPISANDEQTQLFNIIEFLNK